MKYILLLLCYLCVCTSLQAQTTDAVFLGNVTIKDAKTYTYKLQFKDSSNIIKGFSVTDLRGPDETKTSIWGTINTAKKEIHYRETGIIYTKSKFDKDSFCYIHTKLKIADKKGMKMLRGNFTGYKKDGKSVCAKGSVALVASEDLINKLMKLVDTSKTPLPKIKPEEQKPVPVVEEKDNYVPGQVLYVAPGKTIEINCKGAAASVEIWDHEKVDGDVVTLSFNNKTILDKYALVAAPKTFELPLSGAGTKDVLSLTANNEGAEPPATFRLKITTGDRVYTVQTTTTLSEGVQVVLMNK